ncbi:MAG: hypothetical protein Q8922_00490 [Bacteroidota bacterium]|nr:hypothetical protein [Bacteroidota bacterium]MDP4232511.1 hypothetical protein [Bacteroidota bacterium]MDP4241646.1 hypothetical protein [Bacteroidota bacterium]MDP4286391.1 hypothetical protein [Bacteroidota bacterium]
MRKLLLPLAACSGILVGCASGHLTTPSGHPEIAVRNADWKRASIAIAEYNLSKGREFDHVNPNELVLYEAVHGSDGTDEIHSKTVYTILPRNDSLVIESHRFFTSDLDDEAVSEALDQATLDLEQQELAEIARMMESNSQGEIASPGRAQ